MRLCGRLARRAVLTNLQSAAYTTGHAEPHPRSLWIVTGWISVICAIFIVSTTAFMTIRAYLPLPIADEWEELTPADHISHLFSAHNEHVILFPRLVFLMDKVVFGGTQIFTETMTFVIHLLHATLLWFLARKAKLPGLLAAGLVYGCLFWAYQYENFILGFQVQFIGVYAAATAAIALLGLLKTKGVWPALALGLMAALTMGNGMLVGLLLVSLGMCLGLPRRYIAILIVSTALIIATYFTLVRFSSPTEPNASIGIGRALQSVANPGRVLVYSAAYLGAPFGRLLFRGSFRSTTAIYLAAGIGCLGAGLLIAGAIAVWKRLYSEAEPDQSQLIFAHIAFFAFSSALLTALGRSTENSAAQAAAGRYGTAAILFWVSLVLLLWSLASPFRFRLGSTFAAAIVATCLVLAFSQPFIIAMVLASPRSLRAPEIGSTNRDREHAMAGRLAERRMALAAILSNADDYAVLMSIYPDPEKLTNAVLKLRAARMAPFDDPENRLLGSNLSEHFDISSACSGAITDASALGRGLWSVGGVFGKDRVWMERVVLASDAGVVVGYGVGLPGQSLTEVLSRSSREWRGYASGISGTSVAAYAIDGSGRAVCQVGSAHLE